jgi:AcrR family transcriptional regulator
MLVPELPSLTPGARRVLDAASELFYERGISAVGVDTIAEVAGVTKKTLYDRFGSKEALVVSYLQHRDAAWRSHLAAELERVSEPGVDRVLAVFDAAISWSSANSPKGCSAINARAEVADVHQGAVFPEVFREKSWQLQMFSELCREARIPRASHVAQQLMVLYEGAIVTVGMGTFAQPFEVSRSVAKSVLTSVLNDSK